MISRSHHCVTGGVIRGMLPQNVSPPKWGDAAHRDHPMEPTGEGGLGILSLVSSSLGFMKIEDDLIEVVLDQYVLLKV